MIKLIAIDLDGTLLNSQHEVSEQNLAALAYANQKGVKIVLCTGRPYFSMKTFVHQIGFTTPNDYIITSNGGFVQKAADGEVLVAHTISKADVLEWYREALRLDLPIVAIDTEQVFEPLHYPPQYPSLYLVGKTLPSSRMDFESLPNQAYNKCVIATEQDHLDKQIPLISPELKARFSVAKSQATYLEVLKQGVNKGDTLLALAQQFGLEVEELMAIGDQANDIPMLQAAGVGVAMGNATEEVKQLADVVTATNDEDGVAKVIYQYIQ